MNKRRIDNSPGFERRINIMTKEYLFNISILTHDKIKKANAEKEFIKQGKCFLFESFLNDNDFENYKFDTPYIFKFEKIPYNEIELKEARDKLMIKYYNYNFRKKSIEIEKDITNRMKELKPYHLRLTVEVKENEKMDS